MPPGPPGNQHCLKLKTPEIKAKVYKSYCDHLAKGNSKRSWWFKDDESGITLTSETLEKYLKNPDDFDPIQIKVAMAQGYYYWEQVCGDSAIGVNEKANTASLQMIMRNKFGWDKNEEKQMPNSPFQESIDSQHENMILENKVEELEKRLELQNANLSQAK